MFKEGKYNVYLSTITLNKKLSRTEENATYRLSEWDRFYNIRYYRESGNNSK